MPAARAAGSSPPANPPAASRPPAQRLPGPRRDPVVPLVGPAPEQPRPPRSRLRPWASIVLGYAAGLAGVTLVSLFIGLVLGQVNEVPSDRPPLWLDPVEIGEVLSNLVENATKYAPPATDLRLEVRRDGGVVSVVVSDRGPGTPSAALPRLSDPVYRVIDGRPRPHGLGLGLAVVKGLVEAHGGRVWAENGAGGGARFTLTMPASAAAEAEAPAPVAADSLA